MGISNFYHRICERYPCVIQYVLENEIPYSCDNLYLDVFGIYHICSPSYNTGLGDPAERMLEDIFHYIEFIVRMVKPQKMIFVAEDGVCPDAKMPTQRRRRFPNKSEACIDENTEETELESCEEDEIHIRNVLTTGSKFMARLSREVTEFINKKILEDPDWQRCNIILSTHQTPGEAEHKIIDYIRYAQSLPDYNPNTTHCVYSCDSDLIILGLVTHERYIAILREESPQSYTTPASYQFVLMHLPLMREYLELEFTPLKSKLINPEFEFDLEKIIDDWVLLTFLLGNDFYPNVFILDPEEGIFTTVYKTYMDVLPMLDGYINEAGTLNLQRFEIFMKQLSASEFECFKESFSESNTLKEKYLQYIHNTNSENPTIEDFFSIYKKCVYKRKLNIPHITDDLIQSKVANYVKAIQWTLNYYYNGVCSWSWYYPDNFSPYISDVKGFSDLKIEFDFAEPLKPLEHYLAINTPQYNVLLPKCYRALVTDKSSIIKSYFPAYCIRAGVRSGSFISLPPFLSRELLLKAVEPCNENLTPEEAARNINKPLFLDQLREYFTNCTGDMKLTNGFRKTTKENLNSKCYDVEFPTFKHLHFEHKLKRVQVRVFSYESKFESVILRLTPSVIYKDDQIPLNLIGKVVFVGCPPFVRAKIAAISNDKVKFAYAPHKAEHYTMYKIEDSFYNSKMNEIDQRYKERLGLSFGDTKVLVHIHLLKGSRYIYKTKNEFQLVHEFSKKTLLYPIQCILPGDVMQTNFQHNETVKNITEIFPIGMSCYSLKFPYYGCQGTILNNNSQDGCEVSLILNEEPDFTSVYELQNKLNDSYVSEAKAAYNLNIKRSVFSQITGSLTMELSDSLPFDVGLKLKSFKTRREIPNYSKFIYNGWKYSQKAINLVEQYKLKFPEVFLFVSQNFYENNTFKAQELYEVNVKEKTLILVNWLEEQHQKYSFQAWGTLEQEIFDELNSIVSLQDNSMGTKINVNMEPHMIYQSGLQFGNIPPDPMTETKVFDRIVMVRSDYQVPIGLKGTVIAVKKAFAYGIVEETYDVMFDEEFEGGVMFNGSDRSGYNISKKCFINISHGKRMVATTNFKNSRRSPYKTYSFPIPDKTQGSSASSSSSTQKEVTVTKLVKHFREFTQREDQTNVEKPNNPFYDMINFGGFRNKPNVTDVNDSAASNDNNSDEKTNS